VVEFLKVFGHVGFFSLEGIVPVHAEEVASRLARVRRITMPMTQEREQKQHLREHQRETLYALIAEQVMRALGEPGGLHKVLVRRLWKDHYRVNVFVGANAVLAKIANSYFVQADGDGNIVEARPKITRQY
jgi:16S rRNA C1402 (ribose-2'-O) methylase RsmI